MRDLRDSVIHNSETTLLAVNDIDMHVTSYWNYTPLHYNGNAAKLEVTNLRATGNEDARTHFRKRSHNARKIVNCDDVYIEIDRLLFLNYCTRRVGGNGYSITIVCTLPFTI
ncbi:hypothetical protein V1477_017275 [Vespula maculifrons]|uniref:Uncharacterized protein n=2 Tax=Vespula TaxID=7451 RepID=A0A834K7E9_VESVU|nr:hypothetical protein HZH66_005785 [Vespula vulgaris]